MFSCCRPWFCWRCVANQRVYGCRRSSSAPCPRCSLCYDVRGLGYNEDPQRYWQSGVSLLHHGWKPLAPLWLFAGLVSRDVLAYRQSVRRDPIPSHRLCLLTYPRGRVWEPLA